MMNDVIDLKNELQKIEPGKFQDLCNAILYKEGYKNIHESGSDVSSYKTIKGTPDAYFIKDECIAFAEYTTKSNDLKNKITADVRKDIKVLKENSIEKAEIIYCCNRQIKNEIYSEISKLCEDNGYEFVIYDIDTIARLLKDKYPIITKDYLGIIADTLQVMSPEDYLNEWNRSRTAVKLNKQLLYREDDKERIIGSIKDNDITLVYGEAGCGKTHLVLDLLINRAEEINDYYVLCVKNKGLELYDDILRYLDRSKINLVFVDDINHVSGVNQILYFLDPSNGYDVKIVATVRDYAWKSFINNRLKSYEAETNTLFKKESVLIEPLKSDKIKSILEIEFNIKNYNNSEAILRISQGNARMAMLAGRVLVEKGHLAGEDIIDLYDHYYSDFINNIAKNDTILKSLAILTAFNRASYDDPDLENVLKTSRLNVEIFKQDLIFLNEAEVIDLYPDCAAKIGEQCISGYVLYRMLIEKKEIDLKTLIMQLFPNKKEVVLNAINIVFSISSNKTTVECIEKTVKEIWSEIEVYGFDKHSYLQMMNVFLSDEVLLYCFELYESIENSSDPVSFEQITENKYYDYFFDTIQFIKDGDNFGQALDLVLQYILKNRQKIPMAFSLFTKEWGYDDRILNNNFDRQMSIFAKLTDAAYENRDIALLLIALSKAYLKISGMFIKNSGKSTFTYCNFELIELDGFRSLRNLIFDFLLHKAKDGDMDQYIVDVLCSFTDGEYKKETAGIIIGNDLDKIYGILDVLDPGSFNNAYLCNRFNNLIMEMNIQKPIREIDHELFGFYDGVIRKYAESPWKDDSDKQMIEYVDNTNVYKDLDHVVADLMEMRLQTVLEKDSIDHAIEHFASLLYYKAPEELKDIVLRPLVKNSLIGQRVLANLLVKYSETNGFAESLKYLEELDPDNKNQIKCTLYLNIPEESVTAERFEELLTLLEETDIVGGINLFRLEKYKEVCDNPIVAFCKQLYSKKKGDYRTISSYTSYLFNKRNEKSGEFLIELFKDDIDLLIDLYVVSLKADNSMDYDNEYFDALLEKDHKQLIDKYFDFLSVDNLRAYEKRKLCRVWSMGNEKIADYAFERVLNEKDVFVKARAMNDLFSKDADNAKTRNIYLLKKVSEYSFDEQKLLNLFDAIADLDYSFKIVAIAEFAKSNDDFELFKQLHLGHKNMSWSGSEIPVIEKMVDAYKELGSAISDLGIRYIKHKKYIKEKIEKLQQYKQKIALREFLDD